DGRAAHALERARPRRVLSRALDARVRRRGPEGFPTGSAIVKPIVLVIDDERAIRSALERLLGKEYDVRSVPGGAEALSFLAETQVDAILCDLSMPEMSGME